VADQDHPLAIAAPGGGARLHRRQGPRQIQCLLGRVGIGHQPVVRRNDDEAARHPAFQLVLQERAQSLVATLPAAAVHEQQDRCLAGVGGRMDVEALARMRAVGLVGVQHDACRQGKAGALHLIGIVVGGGFLARGEPLAQRTGIARRGPGHQARQHEGRKNGRLHARGAALSGARHA